MKDRNFTVNIYDSVVMSFCFISIDVMLVGDKIGLNIVWFFTFSTMLSRKVALSRPTQVLSRCESNAMGSAAKLDIFVKIGRSIIVIRVKPFNILHQKKKIKKLHDHGGRSGGGHGGRPWPWGQPPASAPLAKVMSTSIMKIQC